LQNTLIKVLAEEWDVFEKAGFYFLKISAAVTNR